MVHNTTLDLFEITTRYWFSDECKVEEGSAVARWVSRNGIRHSKPLGVTFRSIVV